MSADAGEADIGRGRRFDRLVNKLRRMALHRVDKEAREVMAATALFAAGVQIFHTLGQSDKSIHDYLDQIIDACDDVRKQRRGD